MPVARHFRHLELVLLDDVVALVLVPLLVPGPSGKRLLPEQGAAEARTRLGADTVPAPVVILRSALVGYRLLSFSSSAATVAVWRVGIIGSGATIQPQQAWRTETVSLVWEHGTWRVASFSSAAGPTPPLPTAAQASAAGDLFTEIPRFREFSRALP